MYTAWVCSVDREYITCWFDIEVGKLFFSFPRLLFQSPPCSSCCFFSMVQVSTSLTDDTKPKWAHLVLLIRITFHGTQPVLPSTFDSNAFGFCFQVRRTRFPGMPVFQWHWSPQLLLLAGAKRRVIWASDYVRLVTIATCLKNFLFTLSDCDSYGNFNLKRFYYNLPHSGGTFCIWANWADEKQFIQMYTQHMNVFVNGIELTEPFSCHAIRSLAVLFVFGVFFSAI